MRSFTRLVAAVAVLPFAVAAQPAPKATPAADRKMTALETAVSATLHDAWDAFTKQDAARFSRFITDGSMSISYTGISAMKPADAAAMVKSCVTRKWSTSNLQVKQIAPDVVTATYQASVDQTCDGKLQPPNYFVSDLLVKKDGHWVSMLHQETVAQR